MSDQSAHTQWRQAIAGNLRVSFREYRFRSGANDGARDDAPTQSPGLKETGKLQPSVLERLQEAGHRIGSYRWSAFSRTRPVEKVPPGGLADRSWWQKFEIDLRALELKELKEQHKAESKRNKPTPLNTKPKMPYQEAAPKKPKKKSLVVTLVKEAWILWNLED